MLGSKFYFLKSAVLILICVIFSGSIAYGAPLSAAQRRVLQLGARYVNTEEDCNTGSASTAPADGKTYLIGDSIAEGAKAELGTALPGIIVNSLVSRSLSVGESDLNGVSVLERDKAQYTDANAVIIQLGTNGGVTAENIAAAINTVKTTNANAKIYWVNIGVNNASRTSPPLDAEAANSVLQQNSTLGYSIIDWAAQVGQHPDYIADDGLGVHPTAPAGRQAFADTVAGAVKATSAAAPATGNCCALPSTTNLVGADNPEKVWNYLIGKGLTPPQAAGIMGNMQAESGFDPGIEERSGGGGFGIIQWTGGRRTALEAAAVAKGVPAHDLGFQLDYMYEESNQRRLDRSPPHPKYVDTNLSEWVGLTTLTEQHPGRDASVPIIQDTTVYWHWYSERSADDAAKIQNRVSFANDWLNAFGGGATGGGGAACGQATVDGYAYPLGPTEKQKRSEMDKGNPHHDGTPAYDLTWKAKDDSSAGAPVYAISDAEVDIVKLYSGIDGCYQINLHSTKDDFWYWHGHVQNPIVKQGDKVQAGQQIAEIGVRKCTGNGSYPHVHLDRGCVAGDGTKQKGGRPSCRDQGILDIMNKLWDALPE